MKFHTGYQFPGRLFGETRKDEKVMPVAADFADDDIGLGAHIASLPGPPAPTEADPDSALTKAGPRLSRIAIARNVTAAFACQDEIPRFAGQRQETTIKALHD
jgi:cytochrome c553